MRTTPTLIAALALPVALVAQSRNEVFHLDEVGPPVHHPAGDKTAYSPYAQRDFPTRVFFGDTHHHTANSGDAFMGGNRLGPEDAYRFARGEEVVSSTGVADRTHHRGGHRSSPR